MIISGDSLPEASDKKCNKSRKLCVGKQVGGVIDSADINKREGSTYDIRKLKTYSLSTRAQICAGKQVGDDGG